jgi:hypothetical protein
MEPTFLTNQQVIINGDMGSNLDSGTIDIGEYPGYCVHAIWSGTPVGNITIEGSNVDNSNSFKAVVTQAAGGAAGVLLSNQISQHYKYLRIKYTKTSSTGVLNVYVSAKRAQ